MKEIKMGDNVHWTTPSGVQIEQAYRDSSKVTINFKEGSRRVSFPFVFPTGSFDWANQMRALPANFIHSIDASVVHELFKSFPTAFIPIHDSFGVPLTMKSTLLQMLPGILGRIACHDFTFAVRTVTAKTAQNNRFHQFTSWTANNFINSPATGFVQEGLPRRELVVYRPDQFALVPWEQAPVVEVTDSMIPVSIEPLVPPVTAVAQEFVDFDPDGYYGFIPNADMSLSGVVVRLPVEDPRDFATIKADLDISSDENFEFGFVDMLSWLLPR
jgi:hypothetical protein